MKLRNLEQRDAPLMLQWMHDPDVVGHLSTNFAEKTLEDCQRFITWANDTQADLHLAIVDVDDTYMGTVSLKHIHNGTAEFAITVRACAMGTGIAHLAMEEIIRIGLEEQNLRDIYWCVSPDNHRAVRFYDKNHYPRIAAETAQFPGYTAEQVQAYLWYCVTR